MSSATEEIFKETAMDFNIRWNFPNCIESIDAKHVRIHWPPNSGSQYFTYKERHSIVLQAVVEADLKFVTVDVGDRDKRGNG